MILCRWPFCFLIRLFGCDDIGLPALDKFAVGNFCAEELRGRTHIMFVGEADGKIVEVFRRMAGHDFDESVAVFSEAVIFNALAICIDEHIDVSVGDGRLFPEEPVFGLLHQVEHPVKKVRTQVLVQYTLMRS